MKDCCGSKKCSVWVPIALLVYFIINIRVEAGMATSFERALDGLVGGLVLLVLLYAGARFFKLINPKCTKEPSACCDDRTEE